MILGRNEAIETLPALLPFPSLLWHGGFLEGDPCCLQAEEKLYLSENVGIMVGKAELKAP